MSDKHLQENLKKGRPSWRPAQMLTVEKEPGYRYRWVRKDDANIERKTNESWSFVAKDVHEHPEGINDGKPLTSTGEYREMVLMRIPEEIAQERDAYFRALTDRQTRGIKNQLEAEMQNASGGRSDAKPHGRIVID